VTSYVALLRAVNVGGRKLLMGDLKSIAYELKLSRARTYIASGNLLFSSNETEESLKRLLEKRLAAHMAAAVGVMLRTADEMAEVTARNPFASEPGNRVAVIFLDSAPPANTIETARNVDGERIALGEREVYVAYGEMGMGQSRLRIPAAEKGTARNMNTVARLAELAREMT
jgi:uncharacterized protein (DUF1697 family)